MKKLIILSSFFLLINCEKKSVDNLEVIISNQNYTLNLENGDIEIDWYNDFKGKVNFTKQEKNSINKLFLEYNIDTLNGEKHIYGKKPLVMPNFNNKFIIQKNKKSVSEIYISEQINIKTAELNQFETSFYNFKEKLFQILNQNKDFKNYNDSIYSWNKKQRRIFL
jgi:hypothetical protein